MASKYIVKAACVVVPVAGNDRYLYRGAPVPPGVEADRLEHLASLGMITEAKVAAAAVPELPEGEPSSTWKNDQIVAYAAAHGIDLGAAKTKDERLAVIAATQDPDPADPVDPTDD